ncbi:MAG: PQQ-binding-like beta-propeller repeat protein [bacterium]
MKIRKLFLNLLFWSLLVLSLSCKGDSGLQTEPPPPDDNGDNGDNGNGNATHPQQDIPWPSLADSPWPMYRHDPQGTGRSAFAGPASQPDIQWNFFVPGQIFSSPVIGPSGNIYFGADDKNFYCVDPSGSLVWSIETESPIIATPLITADSSIIFGNIGGAQRQALLFKTDLNGQIKWTLALDSGVASSITIDLSGDFYFVSDNSQLYSVAPSGFVRWKAAIDSVDRFATPVFSPDGNTIYLTGRNINAVNLDGTMKWKFIPTAPAYRDAVVDSDGNIYFVTSDRGIFYSITPENTMRWQRQLSDSRIESNSSPTIDNEGNLYDVLGDTLYAFTNIGELRWILSMGGRGYAHLSCDNLGTVYFGSTTSQPAIVLAIFSTGTIAWQVSLVRAVDTNIALTSDGALYFGTSSGFAVPTNEGRGIFAIR